MEYLCITSEENWEVGKSNNIWGVKDEEEFGNRRNEDVVDMVRVGEKLLFYVRTPVKSVVAVYKAVSVAETNRGRIWADGIYARRIRISIENPIRIPYSEVMGKLMMANGKVINNRQQLRKEMIPLQDGTIERLTQIAINR